MTQNNPKISVIVPCYNQGRFLTQTVESVMRQTYSNWECIIINDGSSDNTEEVAKILCAADSRIKYLFKENGGLSSARNHGLGYLTGDFIQFLDSDDYLLPEKFESHLKTMTANPDIDICVSKYKLFYDDITSPFETWLSVSEYDVTLDGFLFKWEDKFSFPPVCYFVRKDFMDKHQIRFNEKLRAMEDWFFLVQASVLEARFSITDQYLALYRMHNKNMSRDFERMSRSLLQASFSILEILPDVKHDEFKKKISDIIVKRLLRSFGYLENTIKASSIDYKFGSTVLLPLHKLSKVIRKNLTSKFKRSN
jgi:glycosyltransferase involved in cell wall biosynthesis